MGRKRSSELEDAVLDLGLQHLVLELLLAQDLATFLAAAHKVGHDLLGGAEGHILINLEAVSAQLASHLVGEAPQLAEHNTLTISQSLTVLQKISCDSDRLLVVRSNQDHIRLLHVGDDVGHVLIVALVGLFDRVEDWAFEAAFLSELTFLKHVGATDELHAKVETELLGAGNLHRDEVLSSLRVALVAVHDHSSIVLVEFVRQLLTERLDTVLEETLLSIHVQRSVTLFSVLGETHRSLLEKLEFLEVARLHTRDLSCN